MILDYLESLKSRGNWTFQSLADASGVPESTVRKVFSGLTENPSIDTITRLIVAMGGSLDKLTGIPPDLQSNIKKVQDATQHGDPETNITVETMRKIRIEMLEAQKAAYEQQIAKIEAAHAKEDAYKSRMIRILSFALAFLAIFIISALVFDLLNRDVGWFRTIFSSMEVANYDARLSNNVSGLFGSILFGSILI